ncbi:glutamine synthetase, putative [Entamoeba histolytica HM-1:IMSS-B]|uniref:Glutamine synthetase, putative n=6 Tax=Entamoeba histolytica TaxID=5759 RepID=C4LWA3_ENTH1|nr:glutamine synthetase, putative [Entamoeba histolytica HM-1:IMSS]EMD49740.1 glutamine synthetase, putative [Entamoeba histolytica KU27]EMH77237.1 glutamine synthetase, putative [Entamoeba histolytica HM-1:IMSS-B]EMS11894.1 glutamine synthetase [Entamoeba histolytica HM-3:IMSS]ENY60605.1 glutamine synthetase, putative [Entamoeba histolytica HM-1:IMSS-A]GAT92982.1 glutamine synthetase putative [Entamoeba histolytica]|eukprot:XP_655732.2 glutamine synthetase, putative [Entamoeba histolytica HM-1:IMSS]
MATEELIHKDQTFSKYVFTHEVMEKRIPRSSFLKLKNLFENGGSLDQETADVIAFGMKEWAEELGASCFAHWFQPLSQTTARKYDSFLSVKHQCSRQHISHLLSEFTGKQLIQGEPDGSSFPNGGLRNTSQARGYSAWDYNSPVFIIKDEFGGVLYIPAVFCSIFGLSLDTKTPLLRSEKAIDETVTNCINMLQLIYQVPRKNEEQRVSVTVGLEQEFFLIDENLARKREDIMQVGKTLSGRLPARNQQFKDHYWGVMPKRVIDCLAEVKKSMWELGIPVTTIHNEVAPAQYEMAPIFERGSIASDHNMICMERIEAIAQKHGLKVLFNEKPFEGVNGSGKHLNWALFSNGQNLMDFGNSEYERIRFLFLTSALLKAVDEHYDLVRSATITPGNIDRLGGFEAPPSFISVFVGEKLERCIDDMLRDEDDLECSPLLVNFGVETLPSFIRDQSDRNRTSPFAFIGNRFEFRAVGSSQNPAWPMTVINTIFAVAVEEMTEQVKSLNKSGINGRDAVEKVIKETFKQHNRIIYNGDCYSDDYKTEMQRRGFKPLETTSDILKEVLQVRNINTFEKLNILSKQETAARVAIWEDVFVETLAMHAKLLIEITQRKFAPTTLKEAAKEAKELKLLKKGDDNGSVFNERINTIFGLAEGMLKQSCKLAEEVKTLETMLEGRLSYCESHILSSTHALRRMIDNAECLVDEETWNYPSYEQLWNSHC